MEIKSNIQKLKEEKEEIKENLNIEAENITKKIDELEKKNLNLESNIGILNIENQNIKINIDKIENNEDEIILKINNEKEELLKKLNNINEEKKELEINLKKQINKTYEIIKALDEMNETNTEFKNNLEELYKDKISFINNLNELKKELKNNLNNITEKIEQLDKKFEEEKNGILSSILDLQKDSNELKSRLDCIESKKVSKNKYYYNLFKESTILTDDDKKIISKFIKPYYNLKFELLYKASNNDISNSVFHSKCDYKGPTVFIVKTANNRKIGGFTSASWNQENKEIFDDNCFLFNLDSRTKFGIKKKGTAALYAQGGSIILFGPNYGQGDDFVIVGNVVHCNHDSARHFNFNLDELCGDYHVPLVEFEIYSVKNYVS